MRQIFFRHGHANNSSSSHSVIYAPSSTAEEINDTDGYYGWDNFLLRSPEHKAHYLFAQVCSFMRSNVHQHLNSYAISKLTNSDVRLHRMVDAIDLEHNLFISRELFDGAFTERLNLDAQEEVSLDIGLDHQSSWVFPFVYGESSDIIDYEFLHSFISAVKNTAGLLILGGNDNSDDDEAWPEPEPGCTAILSVISLLSGAQGGKVYSRRIPGKNAYVLTDTVRGSIGVYTFDDDEHIDKLDIPYLVDLKITNYCPYGCEFCYQGSVDDTTQLVGEDSYGYTSKMFEIVDTLAGNGVMELVLGGGEPTSIPKNYLHNIIARARRHNMKCGVTTNNFSDEYWRDFIRDGGKHSIPNSIAFSVNSVADANRFVHIAKSMDEVVGIKKRLISSFMPNRDHAVDLSLYAQIVVGVPNLTEFMEILRILEDDVYVNSFKGVTFLGYKPMGRGSDFAPNNYDAEFIAWMVSMSSRRYFITYGVDSVLANKFGEQLTALVDKSHLLAEEGKFTCYIDAVDNVIAPSSFCAPEERVPFQSGSTFVLQEFRRKFKDTFATF